ncbi:hypothetical protein K438DRAFT_1975210 [Mycena galopus ATCC 62051]|nr:hypothetical protein K438DRAFT_1975210 [Mycena galopus ATCC 62051]
MSMQLRLGAVTVTNETTSVPTLATTYFVLALISQLSATCLIIYCIFTVAHGQTVDKYKYACVVEMVVESAAPNCLLLIVLLPFLATPSGLVGTSYPQAILAHSVQY